MPDTHFYRYDQYDRTLVSERVEQFRDQVRRRLAGELTEEQFKPLRLTNGLYLQLHAYMLRIAIPYGTLSSRQLRKLAREQVGMTGEVFLERGQASQVRLHASLLVACR